MSCEAATGCNVFVIADLHFGDAALCAGEAASSSAARRPFRNADEMAWEIVRRWNDTVRPDDTVYVLGDVGRGNHVRTIRYLNGRKHLVAGNRDDLRALAQADLFASIAISRSILGALLTHIPVHPSQLRGQAINVHGHLHTASIGDPHYRCVSVEQTDYSPVRLDGLIEQSGRSTFF